MEFADGGGFGDEGPLGGGGTRGEHRREKEGGSGGHLEEGAGRARPEVDGEGACDDYSEGWEITTRTCA